MVEYKFLKQITIEKKLSDLILNNNLQLIPDLGLYNCDNNPTVNYHSTSNGLSAPDTAS